MHKLFFGIALIIILLFDGQIGTYALSDEVLAIAVIIGLYSIAAGLDDLMFYIGKDKDSHDEK